MFINKSHFTMPLLFGRRIHWQVCFCRDEDISPYLNDQLGFEQPKDC